MALYRRLKEFFTEAMGEELSSKEIAEKAMEEAMKQSGARSTPVPAVQQPPPPPAKSYRSTFDLSASAQHIPAHVVKLIKA
jgi:hypothetical protein